MSRFGLLFLPQVGTKPSWQISPSNRSIEAARKQAGGIYFYFWLLTAKTFAGLELNEN